MAENRFDCSVKYALLNRIERQVLAVVLSGKLASNAAQVTSERVGYNC